MNPALVIVAFVAGSILLVIVVIGVVQAWFPLALGLALVGVSFAVEALAVLGLARSRRTTTPDALRR